MRIKSSIRLPLFFVCSGFHLLLFGKNGQEWTAAMVQEKERNAADMIAITIKLW